MYDRTGDKLGKEQHERAVVLEGEGLDTPRLHVDQKCDLLESNERYAQRQDNVPKYKIGTKSVIDRTSDEIGILEDTQKHHVEQDPQQEDRF